MKVDTSIADEFRTLNGEGIRKYRPVPMLWNFKSSGWYNLQLFIGESGGPAILGHGLTSVYTGQQVRVQDRQDGT